MKNRLFTTLMLAAITLFAGSIQAQQAQEEYSFKVHNTTDSAIKKLLVSEDGQQWGYFDIGDGIAPGVTVTLTWDESTNQEDCKQYFKASFADGDESEPVIFNFCENDLELEF